MSTPKTVYLLILAIPIAAMVLLPDLWGVFSRHVVALYGLLLLWMGVSGNGLLDKNPFDEDDFSIFMNKLLPPENFPKIFIYSVVYCLSILGAEMFLIPRFYGKPPLELDMAIIPIVVYLALASIVGILAYFTYYKPKVS